ncbi:MAG: hypothetical protein AABO57_26595 [Acidobacteriota bacterium]
MERESTGGKATPDGSVVRDFVGAEVNPRRELPEDLLIAYHDEIKQALRCAVRQALQMHKRAGNPVAGWRDGKVVVIPAEEIPVDDLTEDQPA